MYEFAERFMTDIDVFLGTIISGVVIIVGIALLILMIKSGGADE